MGFSPLHREMLNFGATRIVLFGQAVGARNYFPDGVFRKAAISLRCNKVGKLYAIPPISICPSCEVFTSFSLFGLRNACAAIRLLFRRRFSSVHPSPSSVVSVSTRGPIVVSSVLLLLLTCLLASVAHIRVSVRFFVQRSTSLSPEYVSRVSAGLLMSGACVFVAVTVFRERQF